MKRCISIICVLALLFVLLTACGDEKNLDREKTDFPQMTLTVSSWSGWSENYEPQVEEYAFDTTLDLTIHLPDTYPFVPTFSVVSVTENEIVLHSDEPMSLRGEGGTINFFSDQQDFTIPYGESITFDTCTLDAGWTYTFTYTRQGNIGD